MENYIPLFEEYISSNQGEEVSSGVNEGAQTIAIVDILVPRRSMYGTLISILNGNVPVTKDSVIDVCTTSEGKYILMDGNTRLLLKVLRGEDTAMARVLEDDSWDAPEAGSEFAFDPAAKYGGMEGVADEDVLESAVVLIRELE